MFGLAPSFIVKLLTKIFCPAAYNIKYGCLSDPLLQTRTVGRIRLVVSDIRPSLK